MIGQGLGRNALRSNGILFAMALVLISGLQGFSQIEARKQEWGWESSSSPGAEIKLVEKGRSVVDGRTMVTYRIVTSGLPSDRQYNLWTRSLGGDMQQVAIALISKNGQAVSQLADTEHHILEDPIDLRVFGGKGEPKDFALISDDNTFRAFGRVIPFPMEADNGPCALSAIMTSLNYYSVSIIVRGLQPNEDLMVNTQSEGEHAQRRGQATDAGTYRSALLPFVKGKRNGTARFDITAKSCTIGLAFEWGDGSYHLE